MEEHKDAYSANQCPMTLKHCICHCMYAQTPILYKHQEQPQRGDGMCRYMACNSGTSLVPHNSGNSEQVGTKFWL